METAERANAPMEAAGSVKALEDDLAAPKRILATGDVETIANYLHSYRGDRAPLMQYLHQHRGNHFVHAVLASEPRPASTEPSLWEAMQGLNLDGSNKLDEDLDPSKRKAELTEKYGVRPRDYANRLDGSNQAEHIFRETVPLAAAFYTARAKELGYDFEVTSAELAANFLLEGGKLALDNGWTTDLDGFGVLGIDTFVDRKASLEPWIHACLKGKLQTKTNINEVGKEVSSITYISLVQGIYASGAMWALMKARAAEDLKARDVTLSTLSDEEQVYWTSAYFNGGEGGGGKLLERNGTDPAAMKWTKGDDFARYSNIVAYNAAVRTSTFAFMRDTMFDSETGQVSVELNPAGMKARLGQVNRDLALAGDMIKYYDGQIKEKKQRLAAPGLDPETLRVLKDELVTAQGDLAAFRKQRTNLLAERAFLKEKLAELAAATSAPATDVALPASDK